MTTTSTSVFSKPTLSTNEFQTLATLVYFQCGINLSIGKKILLESRLAKRLRALNLDSFREYINYVQSTEGIEQELIHMIDVVTTNKTDFFREPHHFEFFTNTLLPSYVDEFNHVKPFKVWSSACSTGEEPYTLAMVLQDFVALHSRFSYHILASDISTQVLYRASQAVYNLQAVESLPITTKKKYLLKSKDQSTPTVRVASSLREKISFMRINLMDAQLEVEDELDVIFCRNVLIYFDRKTQQEVVAKLAQKLRSGGYLFIGHSESLHQFDLPLKQVRPTIFIKK